MSDKVIPIDKFTASIDGIFDSVDKKLVAGLESSIRKSLNTGKRTVQRVAKSTFKDNTSGVRGRYAPNFTYKIVKHSDGSVSGEIGNKKYPGLVHLLEKGHKTNGGFDVPAYPHMADGAEDAFKKMEKLVDRVVESALK